MFRFEAVLAVAGVGGLLLTSPASGQCAWEQRLVAGPEFRAGAKMAFDAERNVVVLFGGGQPGPNWPANTWEWNGSAWTEASAVGPGGGGRIYHGFVYDTVRHVTLMFGGHGLPGPYNNDLWSWDGSGWSPVPVAGAPPPARNGAAMAFDSARGVVVLFGGYNGVRLGDTWEWDGASWTQRAVGGGGPEPRIYSAMAYDAARGVCVLFGGNTPTYLSDTWEWDGAAWTQRIAPGPAPRAAHGMTFDADRGVVLMFGGLAAGGVTYDDAWGWDGSSWSAEGATGPSPRYNVPIQYDGERGNTVIFGGLASGTWASDTWVLDCAESCYPDCNGVGGLTIADFGCFQTMFVTGSTYADCNGDLNMTIADFGCFQTSFVAGCP